MGRGLLQSSRRGVAAAEDGVSHPDEAAARGWKGLASGFPHPFVVRDVPLLKVSNVPLDEANLDAKDEPPCRIFSRM